MTRQVVASVFRYDGPNMWSISIAIADPLGPEGNGETYDITVTNVPDPSERAGTLLVTGRTEAADTELVARYAVAAVMAAIDGHADWSTASDG